MNPPRPTALTREACERLDRNRERMQTWRAQTPPTAPGSALGLGMHTLWSVVQGVAQHPAAALAVASLARHWQRQAGTAPGAAPPAARRAQPVPLPSSAASRPGSPWMAALGTARRHPLAVLAGTGALALAVYRWRARRQTPSY